MTRSLGSACGEVAVSPAATTVENDNSLRVRVAEAPLDPPHELALGAAAEPLFRERLEDLVGERARAAHGLDLLVVLDRAQRLDEARRREGVDSGVGERAVAGVRQVGLLEPDPSPGQVLAERLAEGSARPRRTSRPRPRGRAPRSGSRRRASPSRPARRGRRSSSFPGRSGSGRSPGRRERTAARRRAVALPAGAASRSIRLTSTPRPGARAPRGTRPGPCR